MVDWLVIVLLIIILLLDINSKIPPKDYVKEALQRDKEYKTKS